MKSRLRDRKRRSVGLYVAIVRAFLAAVALPALSVAQTPPAREGQSVPVPPAPNAPAPEGATTPIAPAVVPPGPPKPGTPPGGAASEGAAAAREPAPIALVLPLASPVYGRAAEAVKAGFTAAAVTGRERFTIIAHGDGDVVDAFVKARQAGARVIVGPLVRDDLKALIASREDLPWTIALNQLDEGAIMPARVYSLALAVESEGVQLARRAQADGARTVVVIASDAPLQKRLATAFIGEWILLGGNAPVQFRFDRSPDMLALLRREVLRATPDTVLLALDAPDAAIAKPYLGRAIVYAGSQINDRQPPEVLRDLDEVRFVEIPWIVNRSNAAYLGVVRRDYDNPTLDRLYALGIDAFRAAESFVDGAPTALEFEGATGRLALDRTNQFVRESTLLQFRDGEIVVAGPR
jgi:outer membrane PBP1 activator LpoA protein